MTTVKSVRRATSRTHIKQAFTVSIVTLMSVQYAYRKLSRLNCFVTVVRPGARRKRSQANSGPRNLEGPIESWHDEDSRQTLFGGRGQDRSLPHSRRQTQSAREAAHDRSRLGRRSSVRRNTKGLRGRAGKIRDTHGGRSRKISATAFA